MKLLRVRLLPLALLAGLFGSAPRAAESGAPISLVATDNQVEASRAVMALMTRGHLKARPLDAGLSAQVFDALVDFLDPQKSLWTEADIKAFSGVRTQIGDDIAQGELAPVLAPVNAYLNRVVVEQQVFEAALLDRGFDFGGHETMAADRKDAPRPSSLAELHSLWTLRVKDDWLRLKLAGRSDGDIRATLKRRYDGASAKARKITPEDAFQMAMTAYATTMDPHTDYFAPKAAGQFNAAMSLKLEGIGAYLRQYEDYAQVTDLTSGSPAAKSGLIHVGDRILAVGQGESGAMVDVAGWRLDDVVGLIRGKSGSTVRLELIPDEKKGDVASRTVQLVRKPVTIEDQAASAGVIDIGGRQGARKIGVVTIPSFYEDFDGKRNGGDYRSVSKDVAGMLTAFRKQQVDGVVLDLRDNGGGSLSEAISLGALFNGAGPVVQVADASGMVAVEKGAGQASWTGPLVVVVNRGSASASEILAAALQDRGRAVVVGGRSFGKGTVQNLLDLDAILHGTNLGELKMTIAQFYRINGKSTQLDGVMPDIAFPSTYDEKDFGESTYKNALPSSSVPPAMADTDHAVENALPVLRRAHDQRVATDAGWQLAVERLGDYQRIADRKALSLNYAERKATRETDAKTLADLREREEAQAKKDGHALGKAGPVVDDGLAPSERALDPNGRNKSPDLSDPFLHEAAEIAEDEAMLMTVLASPKNAG